MFLDVWFSPKCDVFKTFSGHFLFNLIKNNAMESHTDTAQKMKFPVKVFFS